MRMNTPQNGSVRYIVFKDGATWYAVALEFNIVESGDDARIALNNLFDAIAGYVESSQKLKGARISLLNQHADPEYEHLWSVATAKKKIRSPYTIGMYGVAQI